MPLLDELNRTERVLAPRAEDQLQREQRRTALASLVDDEVSINPDRRPKMTSEVNSGLLDSVLKSALNPTKSGGSLMSERSLSPVVQFGAVPPAAGGGSNPIIGSKNYQVGGGRPELRQLAQEISLRRGWGGDQFAAWDALINAESSWNPQAQNPTSTAYGLGQFLNATWKGYGAKTSDPAAQLEYMARYIEDRYGTPEKALEFHSRKNWY